MQASNCGVGAPGTRGALVNGRVGVLPAVPAQHSRNNQTGRNNTATAASRAGGPTTGAPKALEAPTANMSQAPVQLLDPDGRLQLAAGSSMRGRSGSSSSSSSYSYSSMDQDTYSPVGTANFLSSLQNHPCLQLILQRAATGSKPGARAPDDTAKLGLVVEGGGMRGVVSGAMLMALHALGLRDCFDVVYGASAGAINSTYFLSGQRQGLDIYAEDLTGNRFINLRALWRGGPVMDLDFLIEHIMHHVKPLDWHAVMDSAVPLKVVASSLDSLGPVLLQGWDSRRDLVDCLKATATVPRVAGQPRVCRGHRLVDAAVFEPVPLRTALRDGCSHALVLCTRPATLHTAWHRRVVQGTVTHVVKRTLLNAPWMGPAWSSPHCTQLDAQYEELVATLAEPPAVTHTKLGAYVLPVFPTSVAGCHPITTCPTKLRRAEAEGWRAIATLFGCPQLLEQEGVHLPAAPQLQQQQQGAAGSVTAPAAAAVTRTAHGAHFQHLAPAQEQQQAVVSEDVPAQARGKLLAPWAMRLQPIPLALPWQQHAWSQRQQPRR